MEQYKNKYFSIKTMDVNGQEYPFIDDSSYLVYAIYFCTTNQRYYFVEQSRPATIDNSNTLPLELVGGTVEYNELPFDAIIREANEELGLLLSPYDNSTVLDCICNINRHIALFGSQNSVSLFYIRSAQIPSINKQNLDDEEDVMIKSFTYDELLRLFNTIRTEQIVVDNIFLNGLLTILYYKK